MVDQGHLSDRLWGRIHEELREGEQLLWVEQPLPKRWAKPAQSMALFAVPWTALSFLWMAGVVGFETPDFHRGFDYFSLLGIPLLLIGLWMFSLSPRKRRQARKIVYLLTDRRAVILVDAGRTFQTRTYDLRPFRDFRRHLHADGSGDIIFDREFVRYECGCPRFADIGFLGLGNVRAVERLLGELLQTPSDPKPSDVIYKFNESLRACR